MTIQLALVIMVLTLIFISFVFALMNGTFSRKISSKTQIKEMVACVISKPLNLEAFNRKFVEANMALARGNTEALKEGITFLIDSLDVAGEYTPDVIAALSELRCALSHHDKADTKGPWNRDFSGYGVSSWKNDLYSRDDALRQAWNPISRINAKLKARGLGWNY